MQNILTSVFAFLATNVDDIFVLMLFYGSAKYKPIQIVLGQYLGIFALVLIAFIGAYIGTFMDQRYIGLLGLFPIYLALRQVLQLLKKDSEENQEAGCPFDMLAIAGVTIANGGDNIGVYIPLLTTFTVVEKIQFVVVFIAMVYMLCILANYLALHPMLTTPIKRYGHIIMPVILFLLGVFILYESETHSLVMCGD